MSLLVACNLSELSEYTQNKVQTPAEAGRAYLPRHHISVTSSLSFPLCSLHSSHMAILSLKMCLLLKSEFKSLSKTKGISTSPLTTDSPRK